MLRTTNQAIERHYFEQFRSDYELPLGAIEYGDKPDVLIRGSETIGVEITNLYIASGAEPSSEQVQRPRRLQVLERAQQLHLSAGGRRFELWVDFNPQYPLREIEPVAQSLAGLAMKPRRQYYNANEYPDAKWRSNQGYMVPSLALSRLQEVVAAKEEKARAYQTCDSLWLLLVVDFMDPAQDQELSWPAGLVLGTSIFARILLYKPQFGQVLEVPQ